MFKLHYFLVKTHHNHNQIVMVNSENNIHQDVIINGLCVYTFNNTTTISSKKTNQLLKSFHETTVSKKKKKKKTGTYYFECETIATNTYIRYVLIVIKFS